MSDADVKMPEPAAYRVEGFDEAGTLYARILHFSFGEARESASAFAQHYPKVTTTALVTADQLRAAVLAERERCAKVCDEQGQEWDSDAVQMLKNYAAHCAAAIREGGNE